MFNLFLVLALEVFFQGFARKVEEELSEYTLS